MNAERAASSAGVRMALSPKSGASDIPNPYVTALVPMSERRGWDSNPRDPLPGLTAFKELAEAAQTAC